MWYQPRSIHRTKRIEWSFILPNRWFLEYLGQFWNQLYEVTESKYIHYSKPSWISRIKCQSWCWVRQWFYRPVLCRRDYSLLVIGVSHYIERINIVEHDLIGAEQDSDGSDGWILIFVRVGPFESTIGKWTLNEHRVMHFPLIPKRYIRAKKG